MATLPEAASLDAPLSEQMVTVWPVDDDAIVKTISASRNSPCKLAIDHYDLVASLKTLEEAQNQENIALSGAGPYLLAWAPAAQKGQKDAVVLIADLSSATIPQFDDYFREWRIKIEQNPQLWRHGWSIADIHTAIRNWADKWGTTILSVGHAKE